MCWDSRTFFLKERVLSSCRLVVFVASISPLPRCVAHPARRGDAPWQPAQARGPCRPTHAAGSIPRPSPAGRSLSDGNLFSFQEQLRLTPTPCPPPPRSVFGGSKQQWPVIPPHGVCPRACPHTLRRQTGERKPSDRPLVSSDTTPLLW